MQRIGRLIDWAHLAEGSRLAFDNVDKARTIKIDVNSPGPVNLHVVDAEGEVRFLALTEGLDKIEFGVEGAFYLTVEGGQTYIRTSDGAAVHAEKTDHRVFARIHQRKARNPELEQMQYMMKENMRRMVADMSADNERQLQAAIAAVRVKEAKPNGNATTNAAPPVDRPKSAPSAAEEAREDTGREGAADRPHTEGDTGSGGA